MAGKLTTKDFAEALYESTKQAEGRALKDRLANFVKVLARHGMLGKSEEIIQRYQRIYDRQHKILTATVLSKYPLSKTQLAGIEEMIKSKHKGLTIEITNTIDETLIGGIKIMVDDEITDYSLQAQLQALATHLTK